MTSPEPLLGPKPPPPGIAEEELITMHMDPVSQDHPGKYVPGTRLPQGYPRRISCHPASEGREWHLPELTPACGQGKRCGPGQLGGALAASKPVRGFGWKKRLVRDAAVEGWGFGDWWA